MRERQGILLRSSPLEWKGANMDILRRISVREPLKLKALRFRDLFIWLSSSMKSVSHSMVDDEVPLANPTTPSGWASV